MFATAAALAFGETPRRIEKALPGASTLVIASEGDFEPRSTGSYSLRAYAVTRPSHPYDAFLAGTLRRRNGALDSILFPDLDGDRSPEIVVVMRSAGTGGFVAADAFRLRGTTLTLMGSVAGLAKDADPVRALEAKLGLRTYRGRIYWGHEVRSFKPCGSRSAYWIQGDEKTLRALRERKPGQPLYD